MASLDRKIILDIMHYIAKHVESIASVRDRMPKIVTDDQYPFVVVNRLNASDTSPVIHHLDVTFDIASDLDDDDEAMEIGSAISDALEDWYDQCDWNIMGMPLLNNVTDDSGKDGRIKVSIDYQLDYIV